MTRAILALKKTITQRKKDPGAGRMLPVKLEKIELSNLLPHEEYYEDHVDMVSQWFRKDEYQLRPIVVHKLDDNPKSKYLILDGHHRTEAAKRLDLRYIMTNIVDYFDPKILVQSWSNKTRYTKKDIIEISLNGERLKPKTTKHVIKIYRRTHPFKDNDNVEPKIYTSLKALK
ncbi:MAG: ParB N-terminal domain-containing protein [Candidatus Bathyarchaeia archaeon]